MLQRIFNDTLKKIADHYEQITQLIKDNLRQERAANYSPFMPICNKTGKVIEAGVIAIDKESYQITYKNSLNEIVTNSILDGNCKLQWKVDFGMRWHALDVDYEMYGKDIIPSADLAKKICKIIGNKVPHNFHYELFLDNQGQKISKSKGNGLTIESWLRYAPEESLAYYMYLKPKTAKRLFFDIIPKSTDEYLNFLSKYDDMDITKKLDNPVYYIHNGKVPKVVMGNISFSLLLNLATACNPDNEDILWGFISKYDTSLYAGKSKFLDKLIKLAISNYNDFIKANKKYKTAEGKELEALLALKKALQDCDNSDAQQF